MSETYLRIIPCDPYYVPSCSSQEEAVKLLKTFLPAGIEVTLTQFEGVQFVDQGSNFESIHCPLCEAEISEDWKIWVQQAYETGFHNLWIQTKCCQQASSLNNLLYRWPAGFASIVIEAQNPQIGFLSEEICTRLSQALGCPIRQVFAHY